MREYVFLNDQLVSVDEAKVSVYDHGFLYGDGIFETMRAYGGLVFCLEEHLDRLYQSAQAIALEIPWNRRVLAEAIDMTIKKNELQSAYVRLTVSRGAGPLGLDPRLCSKPTLVIMARPFKPNEETYVKGVKVVTVETKRNLKEAVNPQIKSLNFLNNILAKVETITSGAYEGIMLNYESQVAEGTVSNLFIVKEGKLRTPSADSGILLGVTRQTVIEVAKSLNIDLIEGYLYQEDLYTADEAFLTNSSGEVIPVIQIDSKLIGIGQPGAVTLKLLQGYRDFVKEALKLTKNNCN